MRHGLAVGVETVTAKSSVWLATEPQTVGGNEYFAVCRGGGGGDCGGDGGESRGGGGRSRGSDGSAGGKSKGGGNSLVLFPVLVA